MLLQNIIRKKCAQKTINHVLNEKMWAAEEEEVNQGVAMYVRSSKIFTSLTILSKFITGHRIDRTEFQ